MAERRVRDGGAGAARTGPLASNITSRKYYGQIPHWADAYPERQRGYPQRILSSCVWKATGLQRSLGIEGLTGRRRWAYEGKYTYTRRNGPARIEGQQ